MKQIRMNFQGKTLDFQVTYECETYIFCECKAEPSARGFFTKEYITKNKIA